MTVRGRARAENALEHRHQDRTRQRRRDVRRRPDQRAVPVWLRSDGGRDPRSWQAGSDVVIGVRFGEEHRVVGMARAGRDRGRRAETYDGLVGRRARGTWVDDWMRVRHVFPSLSHLTRQVPYRPLPRLSAVTPDGWSSDLLRCKCGATLPAAGMFEP